VTGFLKEKIYANCVYFVTFLFLIFPYADKDWGWHLKYGEYFLETGQVLRTNPFTWTLPLYQWINHEWLFDPLLTILFKNVGFLGLSILGGVVSFFVFFFAIRAFKLNFWNIGVLAFFFERIFETAAYEGFRSQILSLLFLSILVFTLIKARENIELILLLPILFLVWANFHGTFIIGIFVSLIFLGNYLLDDFLKKKKINNKFKLILVTLMVSVAATFINPYGYKVYLEDIKHFSNPNLKYVYEWLPISTDCGYCHEYTFLGFSAVIVFVIYKRRQFFFEDLHYIACFAIFGVLSFKVQRYLGVFIVVTLPYLATYLENLKLDLNKFRSIDYLTILIVSIGVCFNFFNRFPSFNLYRYSEKDYCLYSSMCSVSLADYLLKNPPSGKGFNFYDWGGYLIGKGIDTKLFIDGRMHLWEEDGYDPFTDYISIYYQEDYKKFDEYGFDWVIVRDDSSLAQALISATKKGGWKLKFSEGRALYFTR